MVIPWEEWWALQLKDSSKPHVALLPLHPDMRAKFNSTAAWRYARRMDGLPYGYHNMIFSWIDTPKTNYPPPLDASLVSARVDCSYFYGYWTLAQSSGTSWVHQ